MADTFPALQQSAALYAAAASSTYAIAMVRLSEAEKTGTFPKPDSKEFNEMMGGLLGSVVLCAFSIELALKAVCVKRGVAYPKTHDLANYLRLCHPLIELPRRRAMSRKTPPAKVVWVGF